MRSTSFLLLPLLACGDKASTDLHPLAPGTVPDTASTTPIDTGDPGTTDDTDDTGETTPPCTEDCDLDGVSEAEGDCDDADPTIHPDATETPYDGIDQDCDGEDLVDVDGDGWIAFEAGGEDCDDVDPAVNPDAEEVEDNWLDDDCDGYADWPLMTEWQADLMWEGHEGDWWGSWMAASGFAVFPDLDGDGYAEILAPGIATTYILSTSERGGYAAEDDAFGMIRGAESDPRPWGQTAPGDFQVIADIDGDGQEDLAIAMEGDGVGWGSEGVAIYSHATLAKGGKLSGLDAHAGLFTDDVNSAAEHHLAYVDIDADGIDDLFAGEEWYSSSYGRVVRAPIDEVVAAGESDFGDYQIIEIGSGTSDSHIGRQVFPAGDLDGDGYPTIAIVSTTGVWLVDGDAMVSHEDFAVDEMAEARVYRVSDDYETVGYADIPDEILTPGDLDGDGREDLLLLDRASTLKYDGTTMPGRVDVFLDLWEGGTVANAEANAHITDFGASGSGLGVYGMAGPAQIRPDGLDLVLSGRYGISFVGLEDIPTEGLLDLDGWSNRIANDSAWLCYYPQDNQSLVVYDVDGDGDDDVLCSDYKLGLDLSTRSYDSAYAPGVIGLFLNRR